MAKKKKGPSIVGDKFKKLPDPEEARKRTGELLGEGDAEETRGRPKATHGLDRTSIMADRKKLDRLKMLSIKQGRYMYELLDDAITEYLQRRE